MIETIRRFLHSIFFKFIAILLIGSFAFWGIGDFSLTSITTTNVLEVGNIEMTDQEMSTEVNNLIRQQRLDALSPKEILNLGIAETLLSTIIDRKLLEVEAKDIELVAVDEYIKQSVFENPNFADAEGNFSISKFDNYLANLDTTELDFFETLKNSYLQGLIFESLQKASLNNVHLTGSYYSYANSSVDVSFIQIPILPLNIKFTEQDLISYHGQNSAKYTSPITREIEYVVLDSDDELEIVTVSSEELEEFYTNQIDNYTTPETRMLKWQYFETKEDATKSYQGLANYNTLTGDNVVALETPQAERSIGDSKLAEQIFAVNKVGVTKPLEGINGWYIVDISKIIPAKTPPKDTILAQMKEVLTKQKAFDSVHKKLSQIEDNLANNSNLSSLKSTIGLNKIHTISKLSQESSIDTVAAVLTADQKKELLTAANKLDISDERFRTIEFTDASRNIKFVVMYLSKINSKVALPFSEIRQQVELDYKTEKARAESIAKAKGMLANFPVSTGNYPVTTISGLSRSKSSDYFPDSVRNFMLASNNKNVADLYTTNDYTYLFLITKTNKKNPKQSELSDYEQGASTDFVNSLYYYYLDQLRSKHKVVVNQESYNDIFQ